MSLQRGAAFWLLILLLNVTLAVAIRVASPEQPLYSDLRSYQYVAEHGLAPDCVVHIFCHRLLVPLALQAFPGDVETRWRTYSFVMNVLSGMVIAAVAMKVLRTRSSAAYATVIAQLSYGFTYTAYDPYSADPAVLLVSALFALAWMWDRPGLALLIGLPGVFVKQTVALVVGAGAVAALLGWRRGSPWRWILQAALACAALGAFMLVMRAFFGWGFEGNRSARILEGSWLLYWIRMVKPDVLVVHLVGPFGFAWLYALLGGRHAPDRLQRLALGSLPGMLLLVYMQTVERALANWFYFVVPLAVVFLARLPAHVAWAALLTNGLLTARVGLSTDALPSATILAVPAGLAALWALWTDFRLPRTPSPTPGAGTDASSPAAPLASQATSGLAHEPPQPRAVRPSSPPLAR